MIRKKKIHTYLENNDKNDEEDTNSHRAGVVKWKPAADNWCCQDHHQSDHKTENTPLLKICRKEKHNQRVKISH